MLWSYANMQKNYSSYPMSASLTTAISPSVREVEQITPQTEREPSEGTMETPASSASRTSPANQMSLIITTDSVHLHRAGIRFNKTICGPSLGDISVKMRVPVFGSFLFGSCARMKATFEANGEVLATVYKRRHVMPPMLTPLARMKVKDVEGGSIGCVAQRWSIRHRLFVVKDGEGTVLYTIRGRRDGVRRRRLTIRGATGGKVGLMKAVRMQGRKCVKLVLPDTVEHEGQTLLLGAALLVETLYLGRE
ncbi:hypothetical protein J8273_4027 [Carpediemonas membranifera]|uniref:Phospholipid scramblase n=1 Tax=Carpediemonas membranifera TaxID=201153 RepID=A0A8J6B2K9_9EUKA|nr:hypothetical protein J8273_4027 [Carpediemonas membranifera]|eukprot:KAG9394383.1 hypothetical protein J8273_4027 [Carpediemonas membranifera]